jgi:hypothetical protein
MPAAISSDANGSWGINPIVPLSPQGKLSCSSALHITERAAAFVFVPLFFVFLLLYGIILKVMSHKAIQIRVENAFSRYSNLYCIVVPDLFPRCKPVQHGAFWTRLMYTVARTTSKKDVA